MLRAVCPRPRLQRHACTLSCKHMQMFQLSLTFLSLARPPSDQSETCKHEPPRKCARFCKAGTRRQSLEYQIRVNPTLAHLPHRNKVRMHAREHKRTHTPTLVQRHHPVVPPPWNIFENLGAKTALEMSLAAFWVDPTRNDTTTISPCYETY